MFFGLCTEEQYDDAFDWIGDLDASLKTEGPSSIILCRCMYNILYNIHCIYHTVIIFFVIFLKELF